MQFFWNRCHDELADAERGQCQKRDAGEEDSSKSNFPGNTHAFHDGVGEVGVQAHAWCQGDGITSDDAHQNAADGGSDTGSRHHAFEGHTCLVQNCGVHKNDVGHRHERGEAGEDLGPPRGLEAGEFEVTLQVGSYSGSSHYFRPV